MKFAYLVSLHETISTKVKEKVIEIFLVTGNSVVAWDGENKAKQWRGKKEHINLE